MKWLKKIDWKEILCRAAIAAILFIVCAIAFVPRISDYSLRIELRQDRTGYNTQLYWWDMGEEYTQEQSFMTLIDGRQIQLQLQKGMLGWNKGWRLDIIDANLQVGITEFALYEGQEKRKVISADDLVEYTVKRDGVEDTYSTGEDFVIKPLCEDPSVNFGTNVSRVFVRHIVLHYLLDMAVVGCLIFLAVFVDKLPGIRRIYGWIWKRMDNDKWAFLGFALLLGVVIFCLFHDFITGDKVFVYKGDSFYQTYAQLTHTADRIAAGEWGKGYTFFESLGNAEEPIVLTLKNLCALFGREYLAYTMGIAQMVKILLAGLFFYCFLRRLGTGKSGSSLLGMGYACSSYLIARGMWQNYPNEAVLFALWLFGFECFRSKRKYLLFLIINVLCYWNYNGYNVVFYTAVCIAYIIFRYVSESDGTADKKRTVKCVLNAVFLMFGGAAVSAAAWFPSLREMIGSSRVSQGAESIGRLTSVMDFTGIDGYRTLFYRLIGNDILGILDDTYVGAGNWLEDPVYYCGILTVLAVPLGLYVMDKKKRKWYVLPFASIVIYNVWGFVRYIANGFAGTGWKLSSLWIIVLLMIVAAAAWQDMEALEVKKIKPVLILTNLVIMMLSVVFIKKGIQLLYLAVSLFFCIWLSVLLYRIRGEQDETRKRYLKYMLLVVSSLEIICSSYRVVNNKAVLNSEVLEQKVFYNDATADLLSSVEDENDFYRVDKQFVSTSYCDSLYQRYKGTASYIGGVGDNEYTVQFYDAMGLPELQHVQKGTQNNTIVDALLNVRYVLTKNSVVNTYGLRPLAEDEDIRLYENDHALPFGYTYDAYIKQSDFDQYAAIDRRSIMLSRCVLADEEAAEVSVGIAEDNSHDVFLNRWEEYGSECEMEEDSVIFKGLEEGEALVLRIRVKGQETTWAVGYYMQDGAAVGKFDVRIINGEEEYFIECLAAGIDGVKILSNGRGPYEITEAEAYRIPQEEYYADYVQQIGERREGSLTITDYQEESIEGIAKMHRDGIMVFTIPYDKGWTVYVDGSRQNLLHCNVGFMGIELTEGTHEISIKYQGYGADR